jgi:parallel beta-helix repeat protein
VAFRITTTNAPSPAPVRLVLGTKMSVECERVLIEGLELQAIGMDGSGMKFNERCSFRHCHFVRSPVFFQSCKQLEFEGNLLRDGKTHGLYLNGVTGSRIVSNVVENMVGSSVAGICCAYGVSDCELTGNTVRRCTDGILLVVCSDVILTDNRLEQNQTTGLMLNTCTRIGSRRCAFTSNTVLDVRAVYDGVLEPWRFYDCVFQNPPTNANAACISVEGQVPVEIINSPLQTYLKDGKRGPLTFKAYVDISVTNAQGEPLGRVPVRVFSGDKVVATSRTEAVGAWSGHTPPPSSHRSLVLAWHRFAPAEGLTTPASSMSYQVEVDGTSLGYDKQTVPLVVDASYVRPDPLKPVKTLSVTLSKAK